MTLSKKITLATLFIGAIADSTCVRPGSSSNLIGDRHRMINIPRPQSASIITKPLSISYAGDDMVRVDGNLLSIEERTGIHPVKFDKLSKGIDILFIRHGKDATNVKEMAHQDNPGTEAHCGYMSRSQSSLDLYTTLGEFGKAIGAGGDVLVFSSEAERAIFTALNLGVSKERLITLEEFNEQRLGLPKAQKIEDVLKSKSFRRMLANAEHKISEEGESGNDVIKRICRGLQAVATQIRGSRSSKTAVVVTHRLTINWFLRFLLQDMSITMRDFPNCGAILVRYHEKTGEVALYTNEIGKAHPFLIPSPDHFLRYLSQAQPDYQTSKQDDGIELLELTASLITRQCRAITLSQMS